MMKVQLLMQAQENPSIQAQLGSIIQSDQRVLEVFMAMQGMDMPSGPDEPFKPSPSPSPSASAPAPKKPKVEEVKKDERTEEQKTADAFKEEGNALYKAKKFDEAIAQYDKAIEACPNDLTYYNNKAAVFLEQQRFDEVESMLKGVLEKKYEMNSALPGGASFEKVGKVLNRLASSFTFGISI